MDFTGYLAALWNAADLQNFSMENARFCCTYCLLCECFVSMCSSVLHVYAVICLFVCLTAVNVDEAVVSQLVDMGFPRNACVKGVYFSNNTGIETAMNWVMEHMDDPGKFHHFLLVS